MPHKVSYHTAEASIFQSVLEEVLEQQSSGMDEQMHVSGEHIGFQPGEDAMKELSIALQAEGIVTVEDAGFEEEISVPAAIRHCPTLAVRLAKAKAFGTKEEQEAIESQLKFSVCDPGWITVAIEAANRLARQPKYKPPEKNEAYVYDLPKENEDGTVVIGLLADWGTAEDVAKLVLDQLLKHEPHAVIHLGDVYYSGTTREFNRMTKMINASRENYPCPFYAIPGSHDYYAGGEPFFNALSKFNQPPFAPEGTPEQEVSFFFLRNEHWQLLGMDTGYHDHDVFKAGVQAIAQGAHKTRLDDREAAWHRHKFATRGDRRTILLSHHQLYSAFGDIGGGFLNEDLQAQLAEWLDEDLITAWFWGHEHTLQIYEPFAGITRGRCIGHGAFPTFEKENAYKLKHKQVPLKKMSDSEDSFFQLKAREGILDHGYAMLYLRPPNAASEAVYYTVPGDGSIAESEEIYRETI